MEVIIVSLLNELPTDPLAVTSTVAIGVGEIVVELVGGRVGDSVWGAIVVGVSVGVTVGVLVGITVGGIVGVLVAAIAVVGVLMEATSLEPHASHSFGQLLFTSV